MSNITEFKNFETSIKQFSSNLTKEKIPKAMETIGNTLIDETIKRSRVRTGLMRGNWQVSEDDVGVIQSEDKSGKNTKSIAAQKLKSITKKKVFTGYWILNPVSYAKHHEFGTVQHRPQAMLGPAVSKVLRILGL